MACHSAASDNTLNLLFSFAIGYFISTVLLITNFLRNKSTTAIYAFLRPISGGLVSGCLLLLVICGGALFWENISEMKGLSIAAIAVIGSLYCERFPELLKVFVTPRRASSDADEHKAG